MNRALHTQVEDPGAITYSVGTNKSLVDKDAILLFKSWCAGFFYDDYYVNAHLHDKDVAMKNVIGGEVIMTLVTTTIGILFK